MNIYGMLLAIMIILIDFECDCQKTETLSILCLDDYLVKLTFVLIC
jgi:hypothetical protein